MIGQFILALTMVLVLFNASEAKEQKAEVVFEINLRAPENSKEVRLWIPFPVSDQNQTIEDVRIDGNYSSHGIYNEKEFGNSILYAEWKNMTKDRVLSFTFKVTRKEVVKKDFPKNEPPLLRKNMQNNLCQQVSVQPVEKLKKQQRILQKIRKTRLQRHGLFMIGLLTICIEIPK